MLLTFLSRLMSSLLTSLLFVTVVGVTANQTILNTTYIENKLQSQNAYDRLSDALSDEISKNSNDPAVSQTAVATQLKSILTPDVLRQKIDVTLKQLNDYFHSNGAVPTLDVSDLVQAAQQAGLQVDGDKFSKPVELTAATNFKKVSGPAKLAGIGAIATEVVLFLGVLAIAIKRRDYRPLANIVFSLGTMLTLAGAVLLFTPQLLNKVYAANGAFASLAHDLAIVILRDFGLRLLIPGVTALLLGILAKYALHRYRPKTYRAVTPRAEDTMPSTPVEPSGPQPTAPAVPVVPTSPVQSTGPVSGAPSRPKQPRKIQL
ncbi:MAG: hypothetical protein ACREGB_03610 [Candidatus Saccharimonadales bacterium]